MGFVNQVNCSVGLSDMHSVTCSKLRVLTSICRNLHINCLRGISVAVANCQRAGTEEVDKSPLVMCLCGSESFTVPSDWNALLDVKIVTSLQA